MKKLILFGLLAFASIVRGELAINETVSNTAIEISALPCVINNLTIINRDTAAAFLHIYDSPATGVTVGSTQQVAVYEIKASEQFSVPNHGQMQLRCAKGLSIALTTSPLSSSSTAPATAGVIWLYYSRLP